MTSSETNDRLWIVLCHLSVFIGAGVIFPLIVYLVTKNDPDSPIPPHARETLNFHISIVIYMIVGLVLILAVIGVAIIILTALLAVILPIVGAIKASNDEFYEYPLTIRFIK